jgi:16S rRNA processing protein RimM
VTTAVSQKFVTLGRISGLYGVTGWVKVYSHTSPLNNILKYSKWYLKIEESWQEYQLETGKPHGKGIIAKLAGIDDRDVAATFIDIDIAIPRDQLPELGKNEFYWTDLEGIKVVTIEGVELGLLDHLFETGANDVMVIKGERQRLLPYIDQVVKRVDLEAGIMEVDWDPDF